MFGRLILISEPIHTSQGDDVDEHHGAQTAVGFWQVPVLTPPPRSPGRRVLPQCLSALAGKCVWALIVAIKILASKTAYFII